MLKEKIRGLLLYIGLVMMTSGLLIYVAEAVSSNDIQKILFFGGALILFIVILVVSCMPDDE